MLRIEHIDTALSPNDFSERIFAGAALVVGNNKAMRACRNVVALFIETYLGDRNLDVDITKLHESLDRTDYLTLIDELRTSLKSNTSALDLFLSAIEECGFDKRETFFDHLTLRVVPPETSHKDGYASYIGPHRDTWGSKCHAQLNWWAPIYTITAERTLGFFPDYWSRPIANDTDSWDFNGFLAARSENKRSERVPYPSAPTPTQAVNMEQAVPVIVEPSELLCFSGAHLHTTIPNQSQLARVSLELRTMHTMHDELNLSAPNIDCADGQKMVGWFKNAITKERLSDS
ncbi:MAG: hypothetical protein AAF197_08480 [Pseudomonadota bacterium]